MSYMAANVMMDGDRMSCSGSDVGRSMRSPLAYDGRQLDKQPQIWRHGSSSSHLAAPCKPHKHLRKVWLVVSVSAKPTNSPTSSCMQMGRRDTLPTL